MGNAGGGELGALALPALEGGVLKGETRSSSDFAAGSRLALGFTAVCTDCGLLIILGLPARLTGGGIGGADAVGRSFLRGSPEMLEPVAVADSGFASNPGVPFLLAILNGFDATAGEGESSAACDVGRDGRGERMGGVPPAGGDLGDCTRTLGGDRVRARVGDLGGEKATIDVGRGLELLQGARSVDDRGVGLPLPVRSVTLGDVRSMWSLGMSSDMRLSVLRWSSDTARRSAGPGERWRGVAGAAGALFALRRFSNWARREETGFYGLGQYEHLHVSCAGACWLTYNGLGVPGVVVCVHDGFLLVSQHRKGSYSCSSTSVELFPLGAGGVAGGAELGRAAVMQRGRAWAVQQRVTAGGCAVAGMGRYVAARGLAQCTEYAWFKRPWLFGDAYTVYAKNAGLQGSPAAAWGGERACFRCGRAARPASEGIGAARECLAACLARSLGGVPVPVPVCAWQRPAGGGRPADVFVSLSGACCTFPRPLRPTPAQQIVQAPNNYATRPTKPPRHPAAVNLRPP
jgi:hypothetical protein